MNINVTDRHLMLEKLFKEFSDKEVKKFAKITDEEERFPIENVIKMKELRMFGIPFSNKYGGSSADNLTYVMAVEQLSRNCATTGVILSAHTSLCASPIYEFGNESQKNKYLPDLLSGKKLGAFGLTEANAGTDAAGQKSTATLEGDHYILNGSKVFITNAGYADIYIVFAMTTAGIGTKGISAFILDANSVGFSVGPKEKKMGIRGSATCELVFNNVVVPKENLLGREGDGFRIAMKTLDGGRLGIAAQALGIAQGAFERAVEYVKGRKQFNKSISNFQNTQFIIAEMATEIKAARNLVYQGAILKDNKKEYSTEAAMAKLFASKVAMNVTNHAIQLLGGYGYTRDYEVERMFRDAKITEIYEGTSEVQKMVISSSVLR